jgi:Sulfotransferase family
VTSLPRLAFIHIPKTAGTSVRELLSAIYGDTAFPGMTTIDYGHYSNDELAGYRFYSGHCYLRDLIRLPSDTITFSVFRNPAKRAISLFRYYSQIETSSTDEYVREAIDIAKNQGIIEFLHSSNPFIIEHLRAGQIRQFIDSDLLNLIGHRREFTVSMERAIWRNFETNILRIKYLLTSDWLDTSIHLVCRDIGLPRSHCNLARANQSQARPDVKIDVSAVYRASWDVSPLDWRAYEFACQKEREFLCRYIT